MTARRPDDAARVAAVDDAITSRRSIRRFLPTPVARELVERILEVASRAPSGSNVQPWRVYVLTGEPLNSLCDRLVAAHADPAERATHTAEYQYYPRDWFPPYIDRRRATGWGLYGLLGIGRRDTDRMHTQHARNFRFFDAPVGLVFTIDRRMEQGSWLDYGMFLQNIMVAARARGLDTCPQAAFIDWHRIVLTHVGAPEHEALVCGMALGHADPDAPENTLVTAREPVAGFTRFLE